MNYREDVSMTNSTPDTSPRLDPMAWELELSAGIPSEAQAAAAGYTAVQPLVELASLDPDDSTTDTLPPQHDEDFAATHESPYDASRRAVENSVQAVLQDAIAGDPEATGELLTIVQPAILRYCKSRLKVPETSASVEDVTQEVCAALVKALPGYRNSSRPFMALVTGIARHKIVDAYRAYGRQPLPADLDSSPVEHIADTDPTLEERALSQDSDKRITDLLEHLSPAQRTVVLLRLVDGYSGIEAAEMTGMKPGVVRITQFRALEKIRKLADPQGLSDGTLQLPGWKSQTTDGRPMSPFVSNVLQHLEEAMPYEEFKRARVIAEYAAGERSAASTARHLGISTAAAEKYFQQFEKLKHNPPKTA